MRVDSVVNPVPDRVKEQVVKPAERERGYAGTEQQEARSEERREAESLQKSLLERRQEQQAARQALLERRREGDDEQSLLEEIRDAVREMNEEADMMHLSLRFKLHEDSQRWMVQVVDIMEDEVIREIPPEKALDLSARILGMIGYMIDERR